MIDAEEELMSNKKTSVQKVYMNPEILRKLKCYWFINITPTERESGDLQRVLFEETVMKAMQMWGPQDLNKEYVQQRQAILANEDPDQFWSKGPSQEQIAMQQMVAQQAASGGGQNPVGAPPGGPQGLPPGAADFQRKQPPASQAIANMVGAQGARKPSLNNS